jgi:hypothetical protein
MLERELLEWIDAVWLREPSDDHRVWDWWLYEHAGRTHQRLADEKLTELAQRRSEAGLAQQAADIFERDRIIGFGRPWERRDALFDLVGVTLRRYPVTRPGAPR